MVSAEISPKTEIDRERVLSQVRNWVKEVFPKDYPNRDIEIRHLLRTEYWALRIKPNADTADRIAALTHDIERAFPDPGFSPHPESGYTPEEYRRYQKIHAQRSAAISAKFLKSLGVCKELIRIVGYTIRAHEVGGTPRFDLVKDADSISFLENKADLFISWIPHKRTWQEVKDKIDLMYNRIWIREAEELAKPFYDKAIARLGEERPENKRRQALGEYWRLVERAKFENPSDEEIEALREAGDKALSLGK